MKDRPCNSGMFGHSEVRVGESPPLGAPVVPCFVRHIVLPIMKNQIKTNFSNVYKQTWVRFSVEVETSVSLPLRLG